LIVEDSHYRDTFRSLLWMSGRQGGLGEGPKRLWVTLASMAVTQQTEVVAASTAYLTHRLGGRTQYRTLARQMKKLRDAGLIIMVNAHRGTYSVPVLLDDELAALEARLGVDVQAKWNRIEANHMSLRKAEGFPTWDVFEALNPDSFLPDSDDMKSM
jgi:hypothetical protein